MYKRQVKDLLDTVHEYVCTKCGNSYTEAHDYTVSDKSADGHTMVCSVCGGVHKMCIRDRYLAIAAIIL